MKHVRTLTVITDAEIRQNEIPLFRGAVINSLGEHPNVYFHNIIWITISSDMHIL